MTWFAPESCRQPAYPLFFAKGPRGESQDDGVNGSRHTAVFTDSTRCANSSGQPVRSRATTSSPGSIPEMGIR